MTITPTLLIAMLASAYYYLGIKSLFDEKISNSLSQTVEVAKLYLEEHNKKIETDILRVSQDIDSNYFTLSQDPKNFVDFWEEEYRMRAIPDEAMVFSRSGIMSKTSSALSMYFEKIPQQAWHQADIGEIVLLKSSDPGKVRAMMKLLSFEGMYLLVGKNVDQNILHYLESTRGSQAHYQALLAEVDRTQRQLQVVFILLSITLCVGSVIVAVRLARKIATPINQLVAATDLIRDGNFAVRVPEHSGLDETSILTRAFNQMTQYIQNQTQQLLSANQIIDERRRFIEAILKEISAGLLVISPEQTLTLCNQSSAKLLGLSEQQMLGENYMHVIPELSGLLEKASAYPGSMLSENIEVKRPKKEMHLLVRAVTDLTADHEIARYIITIDDLTNLIAAQKQAAWGEVAQRLAHEIKNPLTPINLSAERLRDKFLKQIHTDQEQFQKYVDTIIHHVDDIGNIVEDFVGLARAQSPQLATINLCRLIEELIFSQQTSSPDIILNFHSCVTQCLVKCDKTQISQVLINLLKNASESIRSRMAEGSEIIGKIVLNLRYNDGMVEIQIRDNGTGIPDELMGKICDPYVTTKSGGTGLGLAIVQKIIEDHHGSLSVCNNAPEPGANITLSLPHND